MKKVFFAIILIFCVMTFTCAYASTDQKVFDSIHNLSKPEKSIIRLFHLPDSLQKIEDEAFEGTAIRNVILPYSMTQLGDRAFAENRELLMVQFPEKLQVYGKDLFAGSENAVMEVFAGSDAMAEAMAEGYRYRIMTAFSRLQTEKESAAMTGPFAAVRTAGQQRNICSAEIKGKRTGRTDAELKAEKYQGIAALYIRSRYFP